jgi:ABC-type phosphate transport system substrate-binding protein
VWWAAAAAATAAAAAVLDGGGANGLLGIVENVLQRWSKSYQKKNKNETLISTEYW